jgi:hypothetical protein
VEWAAIIIGSVSGLLGVLVGWMLNQRTAEKSARQEREWTEQQKVRDQEVAAAALLDERITEAQANLPGGQGPAQEVAGQLGQFRTQLLQAWTRATVLQDPRSPVA